MDGDDDDPSRGVVFEKPIIINNISVKAYIDGGSHRSLIGRTLAEKLGGIKTSESIFIKGFNGETVMCNQVVKPEIVVDGHLYVGELYIVNDTQLEPEDVLLGTDLLCGVGRFMLIGNNKCMLIRSNTECAGDNRVYVDHLLSEFPHCFSEKLGDIGESKTTAMQIELTTQQPVYQRANRIPFAKRELVSTMVGELIENGIVTHSSSPYASQLVIVKKSSGEDRLCVDYRPLNAVTIKHPLPMPVIEELMAKLAGNRFFTALDLMSGYYQIPVQPDSRKYTAFDTHEGHFEFTLMPAVWTGQRTQCISSVYE